MDLLTRSRKINVMLQKSGGQHVNFRDMAETLAETISSNVYVLSRRGRILGFLSKKRLKMIV